MIGHFWARGPRICSFYYTKTPQKIIPAKHPNNCLYAFEVADWLPLARAYLSLQTGCLLLMRLNISVSVFVSVYVSVQVSVYDLYLYLYL